MRAAGKIEYAGPGTETSRHPVETATLCHARSVAYGFTLLKCGRKFSGGAGRPAYETPGRRSGIPVRRARSAHQRDPCPGGRAKSGRGGRNRYPGERTGRGRPRPRAAPPERSRRVAPRSRAGSRCPGRRSPCDAAGGARSTAKIREDGGAGKGHSPLPPTATRSLPDHRPGPIGAIRPTWVPDPLYPATPSGGSPALRRRGRRP